ncbi:aspartate aminotransferase family protein [Fodinibius sediminis]|uniref:Acetylornithine aminotransferase n=1 Tax=Fodinibius sediminis TaxID=1214077 RepID=A0A521BZB7_9BACT|nr:aspartate aminotransferase family protein [Fodinibius sediminis]SMO52562.1 acetylornithine aminotransferase apoenzyme [Fodinibius sediminis]
MSDTAQELAHRYHVDLYGRYPITLVEGKGVKVKDTDGNEYIDALAGIAVNSLGHSHPRVVEAIQDQAARLMHISNFYYSEPQSKLVQKLAEVSGLDQSFLCNSGAEAMEGSIKLARKYGSIREKKGKILSMKNCFHGRTLGTIAMGKKKYQKGFHPLPGGFDQVPVNDVEALRSKADEETIAIVMEPVQGEGGIHPVQEEYMQEVRALCDQYDILMILDEIQCGIARTGKMFAYQHYGILPDIVASAKALGNGFPIGAVITKKEVAEALEHGEHGTTYGGNPLASAASYATLSVMQEENMAEQAAEKGAYFMDRLREAAENENAITQVRGKGLMIGAELNFKGGKVVKEMMKRGVLSNCASGNVMRFVPPLIITEEEIDTVVNVFLESLKAVKNYAKA